MKKYTGAAALLGAALVWCMAFAAQSSVSDSIEPFTFNMLRSILASLFLVLILFMQKKVLKKHPKGQSEPKKLPLRGGAVCGLFLFVAVNLQQYGIMLYPEEAAAAGRAGFLTATYVVMIALFSVISGKKLRLSVLFATVFCLVGMYLLCLSEGFGGIYLGDGLMLLCALSFAGYILVVDRLTDTDGVWLCCIQFAVCGLLSLLPMLLFEHPVWSSLTGSWLEILYVGIFSGGIGYTLQIIGQKYTEPTVASILMSPESVFAALAGWLLLGEELTRPEIIGCALMFISIILAQLPDFHKQKSILQDNGVKDD